VLVVARVVVREAVARVDVRVAVARVVGRRPVPRCCRWQGGLPTLAVAAKRSMVGGGVRVLAWEPQQWPVVLRAWVRSETSMLESETTSMGEIRNGSHG
jgi:hypothetical protein